VTEKSKGKEEKQNQKGNQKVYAMFIDSGRTVNEATLSVSAIVWRSMLTPFAKVNKLCSVS